jgi:Ca-activated chloride channel family protein
MNAFPIRLAAALALLAVAPALPAAQPADDSSGKKTSSGSDAIILEIAPERSAILSKAGAQTLHLNIQIQGAERQAQKTERAPLNVAFVLDKSGSMNGDDKWGYVRRALENAFERVGEDDYVSLVAYDTEVQVVFSPTRNLEADWAARKLSDLSPGGSTNLHGGLKKGAEMAKEHLGKRYVNRVILLSDGLANVGPSSPRELGALAEELSGQGLVMSAIGVGADYNEDLMLNIAKNSGGAYYFIDDPKKIASIFDEEMQGLLSVVARDVELFIRLPEGVTFKKSLDKGDSIAVSGQTIRLRMPEIASRQTSNLMLELEVAPGEERDNIALAEVEVRYADALRDNAPGQISQHAAVRAAASPEAVEASANAEVIARVYQLQSVANREQAMKLMDEGRAGEAQQLYAANRDMLQNAPAAVQSSAGVAAEMEQNATDQDAYASGDVYARKRAQSSQYEAKK